MNSGTAEHEQNGVTIPKPGGRDRPDGRVPAGERAPHLLGRDERAQERDQRHDAGQEQQDLGHVVEEERDRLAELRRRVEAEHVEGDPGRERQGEEPGDEPERPCRRGPSARTARGRGGPRGSSSRAPRRAPRGQRRRPPRRARSTGSGRWSRGGPSGPGRRRAASPGGWRRCSRARRAPRPSRTRSAGRRAASAGSRRARGPPAARRRPCASATSGARRSIRGWAMTGSSVRIGTTST